MGRIITVLAAAASSLLALPAYATPSNLPAGVLVAELPRINNLSAYGIELEVGTPPQKNIVEIDTGSFTVGLNDAKSSICELGNHPCVQYGTYNNLTSSTAKYAGPGYSNVLYTQGNGVFVNDTITVGGKTIKAMEFGVVNNYSNLNFIGAPFAGIFGLSAYCPTKKCDSFPTFVQQLYDRGIIHSRTYGIYLGLDNPDATGSIVFGGYDKAKQSGPVHTVPMVPVTDPDTSMYSNYLNYTGFTYKNASGSYHAGSTAGNTFTLLDTGNPNFSIDTRLFKDIAAFWKIDPALRSQLLETYPVDCKFRQPGNETLTLTVAPGVSFEMPLHSFITQKHDGTCVTYLTPEGPGWGDPLIRNLYVVFDIDKLQFQISLAKYTNETDIVAL